MTLFAVSSRCSASLGDCRASFWPRMRQEKWGTFRTRCLLSPDRVDGRREGEGPRAPPEQKANIVWNPHKYCSRASFGGDVMWRGGRSTPLRALRTATKSVLLPSKCQQFPWRVRRPPQLWNAACLPRMISSSCYAANETASPKNSAECASISTQCNSAFLAVASTGSNASSQDAPFPLGLHSAVARCHDRRPFGVPPPSSMAQSG